MRLVLLAASVLCSSAFAFACVDVPTGVRAQFAAPGPVDRSNYRQGPHGLAPPAEMPTAKESGETGQPAAAGSPDGGAPVPVIAPVPAPDGGVS